MIEMGRDYSRSDIFNLGHGQAIGYIEFDFNNKVWIAHCNEYGNVIKYCPFCGMTLPLKNNVGTYKG